MAYFLISHIEKALQENGLAASQFPQDMSFYFHPHSHNSPKHFQSDFFPFKAHSKQDYGVGPDLEARLWKKREKKDDTETLLSAVFVMASLFLRFYSFKKKVPPK